MANLLVIDDDKDILRLLEFTLKRAGHQVTLCHDGPQGLALTEMDKPDLVVCDVMMPNMTGYDFCKQVRANPDLRETPIIIYSARFQPIDKQTALDAGATDYLPKSISPDALIKRIADLVARPAPAATHGLIGLFSLRGGVGVTSLAVNLSIGLTLTHKTNTILVDLDQSGGHTALMLGLRPDRHIIQLLAEAEGKFSRDLIQPYLLQHPSGVQLLTSPPTFEPMFSSAQAALPELLKGLKANFPITVLDMPAILEPHFEPILQLLTKVVLVLSPDMPSVQSAALALQGLLKQGLADQDITLVVNQLTPYHTVPVNTIQKVLKRPIMITIPFEPEMIKAVNNGQPFLLSNPKSMASAAIGKLAQAILA
jgi:pilus assembly protein CpaE